MEFTLGTMPTTRGNAEFSRGIRIYTWIYDYRDFNIGIQWSHKSDSACGWSITSKVARFRPIAFMTARKYRKIGGMHLYRMQKAIMWRVFS